MLISIVIPTYNGEKFLTTTIESVIAQTLTDWELILVDDGSQDTTISIAQDYVSRDGRIRFLAQQTHNVAAARNAGVGAADPASEFIAFLDHDDCWVPEALETLLTLLRKHPEAAAAHGLARYIDDRGEACQGDTAEQWARERQGLVGGQLVAWPVEWPTTFAVEAVANCIHTPGQVLIRRAALDRVGLLDSSTVPSDDYDLWLRLTRIGPIVTSNSVVLGFRQHASNASRQKALMEASERTVRSKLITSADASKEQKRLAAQGWDLWEQRLVALRLEWARQELQKRDWLRAVKHIRHAALVYLPSRHYSGRVPLKS